MEEKAQRVGSQATLMLEMRPVPAGKGRACNEGLDGEGPCRMAWDEGHLMGTERSH